MRTLRKYLLFLLVLILVAFAFKTVDAQGGGEELFPNNVVLTGDFLKFYLSVPEHELLFGNAISNEMEDMVGKPVQYFDRARFELVETDHGPQVQLAKLGSFLYDETKVQQVGELFPSSTCRLFPESGHRVCYAFLQFYDEHHGQEYLGNPVSDMVIENGLYVQYFEYARLEYHYNNAVGKKVVLTNIGLLEMINLYGHAPKPVTRFVISSTQSAVPVQDVIQARAFVSNALVAPGSPNTLFVVVQQPGSGFKGVAGAKVDITVQSGGKTTRLAQFVTDEDGIARVEVPAFDLAPQQIVKLDAVANYENQTVTTSVSYRIWY